MIKHLFKALLKSAPPDVSHDPALDRAGKTHHLELYYFKSCPYCQKVLDKEKELRVPMVFKDIKEHPIHEEELIKIGGKKQVPCLVVDGKPMYESNDIVHYLVQNYAH